MFQDSRSDGNVIRKLTIRIAEFARLRAIDCIVKRNRRARSQEATAPNVRVLSHCDVICIANANTSHTHHRDPVGGAMYIRTNKSYDRHP